MSRLENTGKNLQWNVIASLVPLFTGIILRFAFMHVLGEEYLGINGLFTSVLGVLSFADLGLATIFTFSFYKPISQNDTEYVLTLLTICKKVFTIIAFLVFILGLCMLPFLKYIIKGAQNIQHIPLLFLCSLITTVSSYFLVHKTTYVAAKQKAYTLVPIELMMNTLTSILQIAVILLFKNYLYFSLTGVFMVIARQVAVNAIVNKKYPECTGKSKGSLKPEDKKNIQRNVKAMLANKFGSVFVLQTDNIITSAFINISVTGLLSNYVLIKTTVLGMVSLIQNSIAASMGDLIASEDETVQLNVFFTYAVFNSFILCVCFCGIGVLSTPFISLIFGQDKIIDEFSVFLICCAFYFTYQIYALYVLTTASGNLHLTAFVPLIEGSTNLIVSLIAVQFLGLPGVFLGTVCGALGMYFFAPQAVFHKMYHISSKKYYSITLKFFLTTLAIYAVGIKLRAFLMPQQVTFGSFFILSGFVGILALGVPFIFWHKEPHFIGAKNIVQNFIQAKIKK